MKADGYIVIEDQKILITARYSKDVLIFKTRDEGEDGIHFISEEEYLKKSIDTLHRLTSGERILL